MIFYFLTFQLSNSYNTMFTLFQFANATSKARRECVKEINDVIERAGAFDAFCAGDYVRNVLAFIDVADARDFSTVDLYFPDKELIEKFLASEITPNLKENNSFDLIKLDIFLAPIICHERKDYQINFSIDRFVYRTDEFAFIDSANNLNVIGDSMISNLANEIANKEVVITQNYIDRAHCSNDFTAYLVLLKEGYSFQLPNGLWIRYNSSVTNEQALLNFKFLCGRSVKLATPVVSKPDAVQRKKRIAELLKELNELIALDVDN